MSTELLEQCVAAGDLGGLTDLLTHTPALATANTSLQVSPLLLSCYYKKPQVTALLLKYVTDLSIFEAAAVGSLDVVAYKFAADANSASSYADDGFTPLGLACYFGRFEVAQYLVLKGVDVNQPSNNGFNVFPLHSAVAGNFLDITLLLINNGAHINVQQQAGVTPLHTAAQNGNIDILILLLEHGAEVNARMEGGKLPADLAREKGHTEIAEILSPA